jgi:hypothetical protein
MIETLAVKADATISHIGTTLQICGSQESRQAPIAT